MFRNKKVESNTYKLYNSEFGCRCNRDEKCQYENTCQQLMLEGLRVLSA